MSQSSRFSSQLSAKIIDECIQFSRERYWAQNSDLEYTADISFGSVSHDAAPSATSYIPDLHAVPDEEARLYYTGLHSKPRLVYRTGKEHWSMHYGPWVYPPSKELYEVFAHPITVVWNHDLAWKVVNVMDAHTIRFTTIDVVRFKDITDNMEGPVGGKEPAVGRVTIWIGVFPESTSATAAHDAAQDVLALLKDYEITDVDVEFRESYYTREVGPTLLKPVHILDPLVDVVGPLTTALGLSISTRATPNTQGTMALYLAEGGGSDKLLGLSCRHVLIGSKEANIDYVYRPNMSSRNVLLLGKNAFINLTDSIKLKIGEYGRSVDLWRRQIEWLMESEKDTETVEAEKAKKARIETQRLLDMAEIAMEALWALLNQIRKDWKNLDNRVIGKVVRSPAIRLGVGDHRFTEDWGIFELDREKFGDSFQGNKLDLGSRLGTEMTPTASFKLTSSIRHFLREEINWGADHLFDGLLPLTGTVTDELMRTPDMRNSYGEPCLLVLKNGNATGTTLGRANGIFSVVRDYFTDMSVHQTSMEWGIINFNSKANVFSGPGDSGSIIADVRGRIGGMLTGGSGRRESPDITYATPFWWLLERIKANGFPDVHLNVA